MNVYVFTLYIRKYDFKNMYMKIYLKNTYLEIQMKISSDINLNTFIETIIIVFWIRFKALLHTSNLLIYFL